MWAEKSGKEDGYKKGAPETGSTSSLNLYFANYANISFT